MRAFEFLNSKDENLAKTYVDIPHVTNQLVRPGNSVNNTGLLLSINEVIKEDVTVCE